MDIRRLLRKYGRNGSAPISISRSPGHPCIASTARSQRAAIIAFTPEELEILAQAIMNDKQRAANSTKRWK